MENLEGILPVLPPDTVRTERLLLLPRQGTTQIYIGCPIWASKAWLGGLYPDGTKPTQFLRAYSQVFNCVELNSSFYHMPNPNRVSQWSEETPLEFRFCPKVFRGITENLGSSQMPALVKEFCEVVSHFRSRLGLAFAQFSESFGPIKKPLLEKFLMHWPETVPLAVELRHPDWFHHNGLLDEIVNLFYRRNVTAITTDTVGRKDVLHLSLTQPKAFIRFQGNEGHSLDEMRIKEWGTRIRKWQSRSLEEIYFFTHQPTDVGIPETAQLAVREILKIDLPKRIQSPKQMEML